MKLTINPKDSIRLFLQKLSDYLKVKSVFNSSTINHSIPVEFQNNLKLIKKSKIFSNIELTNDFKEFIKLIYSFEEKILSRIESDPITTYFYFKSITLTGDLNRLQKKVPIDFSIWPGYLTWYAAGLTYLGNFKHAEEILHNSLSSSKMINDPEILLEVLSFLAKIYNETGRSAKVFLLHERAILLEKTIIEKEFRDLSMVPFLWSLAIAYIRIGDLTNGQNLLQNLKHVTNTYGERYWRLRTELSLGHLVFRQGKFDEYQQFLDNASDCLSQITDKIGEITILYSSASLKESIGDINGAINTYSKCLTKWIKLNNDIMILYCNYNLGRLQNVQGDHKGAENSFNTALKICDKLKRNDFIKKESLNGLAISLARRGRFNEATKIYQDALVFCEENNMISDKLPILNNIGILYFQIGKTNEAEDYFEQTLELIDSLQTEERSFWRDTEAHVLENQGRLQGQKGNFETALSFFEKASEIRKTIGEKVGIAQMKLYLGQVQFAFGDSKNALSSLVECVEICEEIGLEGFPYGEAEQVKSMIFLDLADISSAKTHLRKAEELAQQVDSRSLSCKVRFGHAQIDRSLFLEGYKEKKTFVDDLINVKREAQDIELLETSIGASLLVADYFLHNDITQAENYIKEAQVIAAERSWIPISTRCLILSSYLKANQLDFTSSKQILDTALDVAKKNSLNKEQQLIEIAFNHIEKSEMNLNSIQETIDKEPSSIQEKSSISIDLVSGFIQDCQKLLIIPPEPIE